MSGKVRDSGYPFLTNVIQLIGTLIYTDSWNRYADLKDLGYNHQMVNHSVEFVSSTDKQVHTQSIEGYWHTVKRSFPSSGRSLL